MQQQTLKTEVLDNVQGWT